MRAFQTAIQQARETGDADGVIALLADDVVFRSPVVYSPYQGKKAVEPLLQAVVRVFDDFEFTRVIGEEKGRDHACVFRARIGEMEVEGCDFLHTREDGLIDEFFVMVRPLSGAMALAEAMRRQMAAAEA